ncbi:MAG: nucleotidyltransferase domain-containing protein [bacterium]
MVDESTLKIVRDYLKALRNNGVPVSFGVVFGSSAKGKAGPWSDIDLLVVSPRFDNMRARSDVALLWRIAARTDSRVEPIPCGETRWLENDASPIIEIARREGQRVTASESA